MTEICNQIHGVKSLSKIIGLHPITVYRKLKTAPQTLPKHVRIGERVYFTQQAIDDFLSGKNSKGGAV